MSHSSVCPKAKMFNHTCGFFAGPWLSLLVLALAASNNIFGKETLERPGKVSIQSLPVVHY